MKTNLVWPCLAVLSLVACAEIGTDAPPAHDVSATTQAATTQSPGSKPHGGVSACRTTHDQKVTPGAANPSLVVGYAVSPDVKFGKGGMVKPADAPNQAPKADTDQKLLAAQQTYIAASAALWASCKSTPDKCAAAQATLKSQSFAAYEE